MGPILVVDDNLDFRLMVRDLLERNGYHVISVGSEDSALQAVLRQPISLVITDIYLPTMSSFELTHRLWAIGRALPPIIGLVGRGRLSRIDVKLAAEAIGARMVIGKPVDEDLLLRSVAGALTDAGTPVGLEED